ncbi:MAG TPA: winged helix-turn-helix transcriptional regulator [Solirubrobacterales bacterium]|nr:winged helix-turn-helix transcriptional regulator [Solirubrobacterales bacterium]
MATPLNVVTLERLTDGPMRLADLHGSSGSAPQSTVRAYLKNLEREHLLTRRSTHAECAAEFALTSAGRDLLVVVGALRRWLVLSPEGPLDLSTEAGKAAIKALEGGWSSTMLPVLCNGPQSLSVLARTINSVSYPSLDRRLTAMRRAGQVRACPTNGMGTPYELTTWLKQGVVPLAAAVRWENSHFPDDAASPNRFDVEAGLLLALPLLQMETGLSGSCRLEVDINDGQGRLCGAIAIVEQGSVVSSSGGVRDQADSWATGTPPAWAKALVEADVNELNIGGHKQLARGLTAGLQEFLFGADEDRSASLLRTIRG